MIQRRQTIFLIFSILILIGYCFAPIVKVEGGGQSSYYLYPYSMHFAKNIGFPVIGHYFVLVTVVAACITMALNLITIFLYTKRKVQIALCWLSIIPLIYAFCFVYYKWSSIEAIQDQFFYFGNLSPLVAIVFIFLAIFYIRKDEELVKSVDRLR